MHAHLWVWGCHRRKLRGYFSGLIAQPVGAQLIFFGLDTLEMSRLVFRAARHCVFWGAEMTSVESAKDTKHPGLETWCSTITASELEWTRSRALCVLIRIRTESMSQHLGL